MRFEPVYIIDGARSPFLKARNAPGPFSASDLAVQTCRELLLRQRFAPTDLSEVITGCAAPSADEVNIGRLIGLRLGTGHAVPGWTVMRNCASGMQALDSGIMSIQTGRSDLVLSIGVDALSHAPLLLTDELVHWLAKWNMSRGAGARIKLLRQLKPKYFKPVIGLLKGLTDPTVGLSMGQTAENLAHQFHISRTQMDEYALQSHLRAAHSTLASTEIIPLVDKAGTLYQQDDGIRPDSSLEKLGQLRAVFDRPWGTITAGNSSQVSDGAAALILASEQAVQRHNLQPIGRILDLHWAGLDPATMGLGPVFAATPLLEKHGLALNDIDVWEINEAFAAQVLACLAAWESEEWCQQHLQRSALGTLDTSKLNIHGGAIALGHPVGASGARIVLHCLHTLREKRAKTGMAAICIGGGQGGAVLLENLDEAST